MTMKGSMVLIPAVVEPAREDIWSTTDNPSMDWGKGTCRNDDFSWVWSVSARGCPYYTGSVHQSLSG